ncbi:phage tail protein [uncultured Methylobacterium sp.]|jgi:phage protein U|uniref:phage tail protein n=1 Tax=uncultured Methylobacterium sp. TaxID=157278 RepID=UPI00261925C8|nr:phage tail protein [uncultured Methylobacterium sp.]
MNQNLLSLSTMNTEDKPTGKNIFFYTPRPGQASPGFNTMDRDVNFSWTSQPRLSTEPAMQFTGPGQDLVTVEGRLYPRLFGGLKTLDRLIETGKAGERLLLVRFYVLDNPKQYLGEKVGIYVLTRLRRRDLKIGGDGIPVQLDFSLEMMKYGSDPEQEFQFT